jgi:ferredoxin
MEPMNAETIKQFALDQGLDLCGIASIDRFEEAPRNMHPASIFPEAKSVVVVARRIPRGTWRGIEEGTYWPSYTYFGYHGQLNTTFIHTPMFETACFIEDFGWEAVPYYPSPTPEDFDPSGEPLRPDGVAPDVNLNIRLAGVAAGLGEMGWAKVFLTHEFGPRVRLAAILTDAELEPDPQVEPGTICDHCMSCVRGCSACAIPHQQEGRTVSVRIGEYEYEWGDVHMGRCTLSYHGGDPMTSPFIHRELPGWHFDVTEQEMSEEAAYKLAWTMSTGTWRKSKRFPSGHLIEGHHRLQIWGEAGSYGIEGSRGCMRSCFDHLEQRGTIGQTFKNGRFIKRERWLLPCEVPPDSEEEA